MLLLSSPRLPLTGQTVGLGPEPPRSSSLCRASGKGSSPVSTTVGIMLFILAVLVVVMVHETGHFVTAKAFHMKVEEFFVGFGPRLWSFRRGETEYGLKAIPAGGYVRIAGMNPFQEPTAEEYPRTFGAKPIWQRAIVIVAGPVTHFVMAILFLIFFFIAIGAPNEHRPRIETIEPTLNREVSPAVMAGLRPGDEIVAIQGIAVHSPDTIIQFTRKHVGQPVQVTIRRSGRTITVTATPVLAAVPGLRQRVGRLGILGSENLRRRKPYIRKLLPLTALVTSFIILFALAITYLDIVNPIPTPFR